MQNLTWVDWCFVIYFISLFIFLIENMRELIYNLNIDKALKLQKHTVTSPVTYGALLWYFITPVIPIFNTLGAIMFIMNVLERIRKQFDKPIIKPYEKS